MSRPLTGSISAEIVKTEVTLCYFVQFDFSTILRFWTGHGDITFLSQTWNGAGDVIKLAPIKETASVEAMGVSFEVEGVSTEIISLALSEPVQGRNATMYVGFLDANDALIADPVGPFIYIMDTISIAENPQNPRVTLTAESNLVLLEKARPRRYTHEDQQIEFPGDEGFIFVPSIQEKQITWGKGVR